MSTAMKPPASAAQPQSQSQPFAPPRPDELLMQLATGYMASAALHVCAAHGIADLLAKGPKPVAELARAAELNEDALYRVLRALASAGVFEERAPRVFANTMTSDLLRRDAGPLRAMVEWMGDPAHMKAYAHFPHSVATGETLCEPAWGMNCWDYLGKDARFAKIFDDAMTGFSAVVIPAVLEAYDFSGIGTLVDVAGGHGFVLTAILEKYPEMRGVLFDLERVTAGARERIAKLDAKLASRVRIESGDFFQAVPAGDAIVMKHIIHDWNDPEARKILASCHRALPAGGKLILIESVISAGNTPELGKWIDLEMLALPGGRERTEEEFRALFASAGFRLTRIVPNASPLSVVEAVRQ